MILDFEITKAVVWHRSYTYDKVELHTTIQAQHPHPMYGVVPNLILDLDVDIEYLVGVLGITPDLIEERYESVPDYPGDGRGSDVT